MADSLNGLAQSLSSALSGLTGGVTAAATALVGFPSALLAASTGFVEAFNPALVLDFGRALQDMAASVGVILQPIVQAGTQIANTFNALITSLQGSLLPVIEMVSQAFTETIGSVIGNLAPMFQQMAGQFAQMAAIIMPLIDAVMSLASVLYAINSIIMAVMSPVFQAFGVLAKILQEFLKAFDPVIQTLSDLGSLISGLFGDMDIFKSILGVITDAIKVFANAIKDVVNWLRSWLGMEALGGPRGVNANSPRTQATARPSFVGIEEIGAQARLAGAGASTALGVARDQLDELRRIRIASERGGRSEDPGEAVRSSTGGPGVFGTRPWWLPDGR